MFFSDDFLEELQKLDNRFPGISNKITALSENPTLLAIPTNLPVFSNFYVNAGNRHAILFDINEEDKKIEFNAIYHQAKLNRLMIKTKKNNHY